MAAITITLGTIVLPDNAVDSGKLTQKDMKDWLDESFDVAGAGTKYLTRMKQAFRKMGIDGVTERVSHDKSTKAFRQIGAAQGGLTDSTE